MEYFRCLEQRSVNLRSKLRAPDRLEGIPKRIAVLTGKEYLRSRYSKECSEFRSLSVVAESVGFSKARDLLSNLKLLQS